MPDIYSWVKPVLWRLDPEHAHSLALGALRMAPIWALPDPGHDEGLAVSLWGRTFPSPVGLAAGFDKDAAAVSRLYRLGFGFIEIGGVTRHAQPGNASPRLFRLTEDQAIINRMGLNSAGVDIVEQRLSQLDANSFPGPLAANMGLNKDSTDAASDYAAVAARLAPHVDMLTLNVSSPNTPGLRALQDPGALGSIVAAVREALAQQNLTRPPVVLVKIAPDLTDDDISAIAAVALEQNLDGLVISNTTIARPDSLISKHRREEGGLSGAPLMNLSTSLLRTMYSRTEGRIPLIGVGGVSSGKDVYEKIRAGASLIQLYSALVFEGPGLIARIKSDLRNLLKADGFTSVGDAVGADHRTERGT